MMTTSPECNTAAAQGGSGGGMNILMVKFVKPTVHAGQVTAFTLIVM